MPSLPGEKTGSDSIPSDSIPRKTRCTSASQQDPVTGHHLHLLRYEPYATPPKILRRHGGRIVPAQCDVMHAYNQKLTGKAEKHLPFIESPWLEKVVKDSCTDIENRWLGKVAVEGKKPSLTNGGSAFT
eukprot:scaffold2563_cov17-Tisochrysis_lutea.AAC.1